MPTYLSPGVYVEEKDSAVQVIAGVGTSTAGFIGVVGNTATMPEAPTGGTFTKAPPLDPQLVTNWQEFKKKFGDVQSANKVLANAVYGFFNNGGTRCWVTRVNTLAEDTSTDPAVDEVQTALEAYEAIDEIALLVVPLPDDVGGGDEATNQARRAAIQGMMLSHCERMQDRFAILDGSETVVGGAYTPDNIYQNAAGNGLGTKSNYGAVYFPFIDVSGKGEEYLPPSGHIAGIYARTDGERGVHKAPANASIRGALGLQYRLSRAHQAGLNPDGINVIRSFNGSISVWGARTIGGDANKDFKYINVRRLTNFIRESIDEGLQWAVFEPNTPDLWQKITRNVNAFLLTVWRSGALFGNTPQEAFYVKCDAETNPPELRELGQVVTEIGIAPVRPAEFVIFRISQVTPQS